MASMLFCQWRRHVGPLGRSKTDQTGEGEVVFITRLLFQFVETRPVFTMPRPEVSRSLRVNYLLGFTDLSP